jgi:hypothetical protein
MSLLSGNSCEVIRVRMQQASALPVKAMHGATLPKKIKRQVQQLQHGRRYAGQQVLPINAAAAAEQQIVAESSTMVGLC